MPRQIIDVESSRPAYVRRRVTTFVVIVLIAVAIALAGWLYVRGSHVSQAPPPGNSAH
jgi:hypothetical protein